MLLTKQERTEIEDLAELGYELSEEQLRLAAGAGVSARATFTAANRLCDFEIDT